MKKKVIFVLIVLLIIIQFIQIDKSNPAIDSSVDLMQMDILTDSEMLLLKNTCMDCHSHETQFPSYTSYQPLGWFVRSHVRGGRQYLNFSEWNSYTQSKKNHKLEECIEVVEQKRMPMKSYTWMHPKAKLTDTQQKEILALFQRLIVSN